MSRSSYDIRLERFFIRFVCHPSLRADLWSVIL